MPELTKLQQFVNDLDLHEAADFLKQHLRPVVLLSVNNIEEYTETGHSRVGGDPDLPAHVTWPLMSNGHPMTFIAQLNLEELFHLDKTANLPSSGILYFFFGDEQPYAKIEHQVIYCENPTELRKIESAELPFFIARSAERFEGAPAPFIGYTVNAKAGLDVPTPAYAEHFLNELEDNLDNEEDSDYLRDNYDMLSRDLNGDWVCKVFGYGEDGNADLEYEAALRIHADAPYNFIPEDALATLSEALNKDDDKTRQTVNNMTMLLEVRSNCHTGFLWGDAGVIHYFIDLEDLKARRFDRTFLSMYWA